jgi:hypothetical protein
VSIEKLDCEPLHTLVGLELCSQFMLMFDVHLSNGRSARAFKVDQATALIAVFRDLWRLEPEDEAAQTWQLINLALDRLETSPARE